MEDKKEGEKMNMMRDNRDFLDSIRYYNRGFFYGFVSGLVTAGFIMLYLLMALQ